MTTEPTIAISEGTRTSGLVFPEVTVLSKKEAEKEFKANRKRENFRGTKTDINTTCEACNKEAHCISSTNNKETSKWYCRSCIQNAEYWAKENKNREKIANIIGINPAVLIAYSDKYKILQGICIPKNFEERLFKNKSLLRNFNDLREKIKTAPEGSKARDNSMFGYLGITLLIVNRKLDDNRFLLLVSNDFNSDEPEKHIYFNVGDNKNYVKGFR